MANTLWIVTTTLGNREEATQLAKAAIERRLAACGQVEAEMISHYWWEGRLEESRETRLVFKVSSAKKADLTAWLRANHPYEVPQILAWEALSAVPAYTDWVEDS